METLESFERKVLEKLSESKLVHKINLSNMLDDCNATSLNKLLSKAYTIKVVEDGIVFTDDNGDEIACPNFGVSIADDERWLSSKLPDVPFDVEQGGNLRKAEEAEAAYRAATEEQRSKDEIEERNAIKKLLEQITPRSL